MLCSGCPAAASRHVVLEVLQVFLIVRDDGDVMKPLPRPGGGHRPGLGFGDWLTNFATGSWFSVLMTSSPGVSLGDQDLQLDLGFIDGDRLGLDSTSLQLSVVAAGLLNGRRKLQ